MLTPKCGGLQRDEVHPEFRDYIWIRFMTQIVTGIFVVLLWGTDVVEILFVQSGRSDDIATPIICIVLSRRRVCLPVVSRVAGRKFGYH